MSNKWIRIFEHQTLGIGTPVEGGVFEDRHLKKLFVFLQVSRYPYFQVLPNGVRFGSYVGAIQVDDLTIEIVPKIDKGRNEKEAAWQEILVDMLRYCRLWRGEWIRGTHLQIKPGALLDGYCQLFLEETRKILRKGLIKAYSRETTVQSHLQGRLLLHKQLLEQKPQFWTNRQVYDFAHPYNQWIKAALEVLIQCGHNERLRTEARSIMQRFPAFKIIRPLPPLDKPILNRDYRTGLIIAELLLLHFSPKFRRGNWPLMAVLFDMNVLFEDFITRQMVGHCPPNGQVKYQLSKPFWNRRSIRPDMVVEHQGQRSVIDTKWKQPKGGKPTMEDVRQIYVYNQYFDAEQGILLYPHTDDLVDSPVLPFAGRKEEATPSACRIMYAPVVKASGKLNLELGKELWEKVMENNWGF